MAFDVADFQDFLKLLHEHPEWREQLRPMVLGDELLAIPSRMDRVESVLEGLAHRLDQLTERVDALTVQVAELVTSLRRMDDRENSMDGRMGNIEGELLELRYANNLRNWFGRWLLRAERVYVDDLDLVLAALERGALSADEVDRLRDLDLLVRGQERGAHSGSSTLFAVEISHTINVDDIERANDRALTLRRAGYDAVAIVGGYRLTGESAAAAERLNVRVDLRPAA